MKSRDRVFIRGLTAQTVVGIYDWEQQEPRKVVLNLEMAVDVAAAASTDSIDSAVSYSDVSERLIAYLADSKVGLIETLAERLAGIVLEEFSVDWVRLELQKPGAVPEAETVGVIIERSAPE